MLPLFQYRRRCWNASQETADRSDARCYDEPQSNHTVRSYSRGVEHRVRVSTDMGKLSLGTWIVWLWVLAFAACSSGEGSTPPKANGCLSDGDCDAGARCDAKLGCVACLFDADCGDGQRCARGICATRVPCATSADCKSPAAPACDSVLGECFACASNTDCKTGEKCDDHSCRAYVACTNSLDCPTGNVCGGGGECVECASDADCSTDKTCVQERCEARCASDKDCAASGLLCDTSEKHCVECVSSADCPSRYHCSAGSCERDACEEGASRCADSGGALESCPAPGNAWVKLYCTDHQSCRAIGGEAGCRGWQCTPGSTQCSADGRRLETCNADGLGTTIARECDTNQACVGGECKNVLCQPSATFCRGGDLYTCNADGTVSSVQQVCAGGSYCDAASGSCQPLACTPGEHGCVDGRRGTCKADGSGFADLEDCKTDQLCRAGACVDIQCDPLAYACDANGNLTRCSADGTANTVLSSCSTDQFCRVDATVHACSPDACAAGTSSCNGDTIATCKVDGSAFEPASKNCAETGEVCSGGVCKPKVCEPGKRFCQDGSVRLCIERGSSSQLFATCGPGELCDAATARCVTQTCTPDATSCNGEVAAKCKPDGSGYLAAGAVDCAAAQMVCEAGSCKAKVCTKGSTFCQEGNVQQCNQTGSGSTLLSTCTPEYYFCSTTGDTAACSYDVCTPGTLGCSGNAVTTCHSDGSGYDLGADCGAADVCVDGVCTSKVCSPGAYQCSGTASQLCNATGTAWTASATCGGDTYCSVTSGRCELDVCPPAAKACLNERLGTCTADGASLAASGVTDCKASNKLCTISGCVSSTTDSLGDMSNFYGGGYSALYGNIVYVTAARQLTEMQQSFVNPSGTLRWLVFASEKLAGPYVPIFDTASTPLSGSLASSGAISVPLSAGKYYFFGTLAKPTYFYTQLNAGIQYASFGRAIGSYGQNTAAVPVSFTFTSSTSLANIKLTTVLP